jgi:CBS domain containing-hemolysin-like protein
MEVTAVVLLVGGLAVALGVSFICSLMEATLLSLRPGQIADIARGRPGVAAVWQRMKADIERPIGVILIINTAAHTIGATVAGAEFDRLYGDRWIWLFSTVVTAVMIQFTEIAPKTLGVRFNRELALRVARPLSAVTVAFSPVLSVVHWLNRPFRAGLPRSGGGDSSTLEEISALAGLARLTRQIGDRQERIIRGASRLSDLTAEQVMIPARQVSFLSTSQTIADAMIAAHTDAHTRFPVCEDGDVDRVAGYVNFKEMVYFMRVNPADPGLRGVIRPILSFGVKTPVPEMLEAFVERHVHMAIVRDAAGRTAGMVTLEDIIEELVGDIQDEFDRLPKGVEELSEGVWIAGAGSSVADVAGPTGTNLQPAEETLATWLAARLGRMPAAGDVISAEGLEFTVRRTRRGKAYDVSVVRSA